MKCTYRNEYFYRFEEVSGCLIFILIWLAFAIMSWIASPPLIIVFAALSVINIWLAYRYAAKRYRTAMEYRHKMMTQGCQCMGEIVDAGGRMVNVQEKYYDNDTRKYEYRNTRLPDYWVDVEYLDSRDNTMKTCRSGEFGKKTRGLIGRDVEVYIFGDKFYINIP